jgi:hypothetical protein
MRKLRKMDKKLEKLDVYDFDSLAEFIDYAITDKMENHSETPLEKSIYFHVRAYFRYLQLQLNLIKAKAENNQIFIEVLCSALPKDVKEMVLNEVEKRVKERLSEELKKLGMKADEIEDELKKEIEEE